MNVTGNENSKRKSELITYTETFLKALNTEVTDKMLFKNFLADLRVLDINQADHVTLGSTLTAAKIKGVAKTFGLAIKKALNDTFGRECTFSFKMIIDPNKVKIEALNNKSTKVNKSENKSIEESFKASNEAGASLLNPDLTFENYVEAGFNKDAIKLAKQIIDGSANYNPAFIFGKSGIGKTHLLHALGNELVKKGKTVRYVNPQIYLMDITTVLQEHDIKVLKAQKDWFDNVDVLMFDDFQNYGTGNKKSTIQTIQSTLDNRMNNKKVTLFCADKPVNSLTTMFDERLTTRLAAGLQVEILKPGPKDFSKIFEYLLNKNNYDIALWDQDAKEFILRNFTDSIRTLLGVISRLNFYKPEFEERKARYTLPNVKQILKTIQKNKDNITPDEILDYIAKYYKISKKDIIGTSRKKDFVVARHITFYIIREQLKMSLEDIGKLFHNRDHTTILSALAKLKKEMDEPDSSLKRTISYITDDLFRIK